jgi:hypothetical protein
LRSSLAAATRLTPPPPAEEATSSDLRPMSVASDQLIGLSRRNDRGCALTSLNIERAETEECLYDQYRPRNQICLVRFIARVTQIEGVDVALAAIADDCDLLAFYQVQIGC